MQKSILTFVVFYLFLSGCLDSPERRNPLDPSAGNFENVGKLSGSVLSFYTPFTALPEVEIRVEPGPLVTKTDGQGRFQLDRVPTGWYHVSVSKEGFAPVSDSVQVKLGETVHVQMNLDALPGFTSVSVASGHISRWWPQNDLFLLEVSARVDDPDGINDIEVVRVHIPDLSFADTLVVMATPGDFTKAIRESNLPQGNLQALLGLPIFFEAHDKAGFQNSTESNSLARIIAPTPVFESPAVGATLNNPTPTLTWMSVNLPFDFTYRVEVFRVDFNITNLVWSVSGIEPSLTSVTVSDPLPPGAYFWTVSVVDDFGNWSRSKESAFDIN